VSQSGESAEVVRLAESVTNLPERPPLLTVTNGPDNPLAARADLHLDTRVGLETGPSTMTFAGSMVQLAAVADVFGAAPPSEAVERVGTSARLAATAAESVLDDVVGLAEPLAEAVDGCDVVAVLGRGPARAAAEMGALTLKESGVMAESFATAAFRHGPLELAGPDLAAIVLATEPETRTLDLGFAADLVDAGATVVVVANGGDPLPGTLWVEIEAVDRLVSSAVSIVPIQLLAWRLAIRRGRAPGEYTRASKVTTRE
jgi:glucosamine--fructose-6-phosphate aminotransferase (isomerizing)